jgi:hypothetical protein
VEKISGEQTIAGLALIGLVGLGAILVFFPLPPSNATILATIVGALAGALTVAGGKKFADAITSTGSGTINAPAIPETK